MTLNLNAEHKAYADAIMLAEAYKLFKRKPAPSLKAAEKASYNASVAADQAARKSLSGYRQSWSTATAGKINQTIKASAKKAVKVAGKTMVKGGKLVAKAEMDTGASFVIAAAAAGVAVGSTKTGRGILQTQLDRRAVLALGGGLAALAIAAPDSALADNKTYIAQVRKEAAAYSNQKAPQIIRSANPG
ncbi:hypothetical protein [Pseudophaeobacter sp.]|uniref:hypothetical protein n=1 Tax=Pseudophaeobacter sp. TaxID=1971739 RepID=UPI003298BC8B